MRPRQPQTSAIPRLLKVREVAALLGVTTRTVQTWIGMDRLHAIRLSPRVLRIAESEVADLVARAAEVPPAAARY